MAHIKRIDEMEDTSQICIDKYIDANYPNINDFNGELRPFKYNGYLFYPVGSRPTTNKKIDDIIDYTDWCKDFSENIDYNWDDFYNTAKKRRYENCDVFACKVDGKIHYLIPTTYIFAEFPMKHLFGDNTEKLDNMINNILHPNHTK